MQGIWNCALSRWLHPCLRLHLAQSLAYSISSLCCRHIYLIVHSKSVLSQRLNFLNTKQMASTSFILKWKQNFYCILYPWWPSLLILLKGQNYVLFNISSAFYLYLIHHQVLLTVTSRSSSDLPLLNTFITTPVIQLLIFDLENCHTILGCQRTPYLGCSSLLSIRYLII